MDKYEFEQGRHIHTLNGKPLMGVTTVLSVISKPALIQWSANMAVDYIENNFPTFEQLYKGEATLIDLFKIARTAHRIKKEKAGDWGTELHKAIENYVKGKGETPFEGTQKEAFGNFANWALENKVEFLESEKHIWSREYWIGGICDLVIRINGKKYIADVKTSSGIYNEHFFQMAAYDLCLSEMGEKDIEGYIVINLKKDGTIQTKTVTDMLQNKEAFKAALTLYRIINSLK